MPPKMSQKQINNASVLESAYNGKTIELPIHLFCTITSFSKKIDYSPRNFTYMDVYANGKLVYEGESELSSYSKEYQAGTGGVEIGTATVVMKQKGFFKKNYYIDCSNVTVDVKILLYDGFKLVKTFEKTLRGKEEEFNIDNDGIEISYQNYF